MAKTLVGEGVYLDPLMTIETGVTVTAGSMVFFDQSGTGIVHPLTDVAATASLEGRLFQGVLVDTLTGPHTGVVIATKGVYIFDTVATVTGVVRVGQPVWPARHDCVCGVPTDSTGLNHTGSNPIGVCVGFAGAAHTSGVSVAVYVKIFPNRALPYLV